MAAFAETIGSVRRRAMFHSSPEIHNLTLTNAATEYSQDLPPGTTGFIVQCRQASDLKLSLQEGKSAALFLTVKAGTSREIRDLIGLTKLYLQSPDAGAIAEIFSWK